MAKKSNLWTVFLLWVVWTGATCAQTRDPESENSPRETWVLSAQAEDTALGEGLPVLALDRQDWPRFRSDTSGTARAARSLRAELLATHPSGWQFSAVVRAEAWLEASPDAVTVAALDTTHTDPTGPQSFTLAARSQSWQGQGIKVGTPWWALDHAGTWHWRANAQLLNLTKLRTDEITGSIAYSGAGVYDFNLAGQRANTSITGPFLPASGTGGQGASLSVAFKGEPWPGLQLQVQADDLLSHLEWQSMATDISALNSQVATRAPDGTLNYAALLNGRMALATLNERIGTHWRVNARWALEGLPASAVTARAEYVAGMRQFWLGWDSVYAEKTKWHWEIEPQRRALSAGLSWGHWQALMATDGQGDSTEYRRWSLGWHAAW